MLKLTVEAKDIPGLKEELHRLSALVREGDLAGDTLDKDYKWELETLSDPSCLSSEVKAEQAREAPSDVLLVFMVKGALRDRDKSRFVWIMKTWGSQGILHPFRPALEYILSSDQEVLDRQHEEVREIAEDALTQLGVSFA